MKRCEVCDNEYDNLFEVKFQKGGKSYWFDCLECAAHKIAPSCRHCGVKVLGHGVQVGDQIFCGAHCARSRGFKSIVDHVITERVVAQ